MIRAAGADRYQKGAYTAGSVTMTSGKLAESRVLSLMSYEQRRNAETAARRTLGQLRHEDGTIGVGTPEEQAEARATLLSILRNPC